MSNRFFNFTKKLTKKDDNQKENKDTSDDKSMITSSTQSDKSIFSKGKSTLTSSNISSALSNEQHLSKVSNPGLGGATYNDLGKPLRVVSIPNQFSSFDLDTIKEDTSSILPENERILQSSNKNEPITTTLNENDICLKNDDSSNTNIESSHLSAPTQSYNKDTISLPELCNMKMSPFKHHMYNLETNLAELVDDIHQNLINISKAVIQAVEYFKDFPIIDETFQSYIPSNISTENCQSLRHITKIICHFLDNLLISEGFANSRSILLKRYLQFLEKLNINVFDDNTPMTKTLPYIKNFCIDGEYNLPNVDKLETIIQELLNSDSDIISDQEGSFIAPIRRGLSPRGSILSIVFGIPNLQQEHYEMIKVLYSLFPDIHLYIIRDSIQSCAAKVDNSMQRSLLRLMPSNEDDEIPDFLPPYTVAESPLHPPISMSISANGKSEMTGTLGGYLFPQIDPSDPKSSQFAGSAFAITSAHVVLSESQDYPYVSVPSKVLQNTYMNALSTEAKRYPKNSKENIAFLKEAKRVENDIKWQEENRFGQVVWGERSIVNQRLSDFAIIKVDPKYKAENWLGNKLNFVKDPTLKFQNTYVKKKFMKMNAGLSVFKIGASSNYTSGQVNGTRLVYWADGKLQTSEFVVASPLPLFATAGDSGAWILAKSEDYPGLGVVGMLHSYDGSQQQFGLFTPIGDILERLCDVTGVQWDIDPQTD
ncbi:SPS-sensor serine protease component Ssy5p [Monosporozyma servazzii]